MCNCKKCGAVISDDFIFCEKCEATVSSKKSSHDVINVYKHRKLRKFDSKIRGSLTLNLILAVIWAILSFGASFFVLNMLKKIKAASVSISNILYQLHEKYTFVKEGLSLSYIYPELKQTIKYYLSWINLSAFILLAFFGLIYIFFHVRRCFLINKKNSARPIIFNKIQHFVNKAVLYTAIVFLCINIIAEIFILNI